MSYFFIFMQLLSIVMRRYIFKKKKKSVIYNTSQSTGSCLLFKPLHSVKCEGKLTEHDCFSFANTGWSVCICFVKISKTNCEFKQVLMG